MKNNLLLVLFLLVSATMQATIINVPGDQPTIQAGIDAASDGDTVLVADGTWVENINYRGKAITVASHYLVDADTSHISATVIDGSQPSNPDSGSVVTFESGEDTTSVLYGFTITGGSGTKSLYVWNGTTYAARMGGGVFCFHSGARIAYNHIRNNDIPNYIESWGGGINAFPCSTAVHAIIEHNQITQNTLHGTNYSVASGVAFGCNGRIVNNTISHNISTASFDSYAAVLLTASQPRIVLIQDNRIRYNTTTGQRGYGGGLEVESGMSASIVGNEISYNTINGTAWSEGGGMFVVVTNLPIQIDRNKIVGNQLVNNFSYGGGISLGSPNSVSNNQIRITNNIIKDNEASYGGGLDCWNSAAEIINNTVVDNTGRVFGGGIWVASSTPAKKVIVMNSILRGNTAPDGPQIKLVTSGIAEVRYSDVQGGWIGEGNVDADPLFADTLFHLSDSSPCIGAGRESVTIGGLTHHAPDWDFAGDPRPMTTGPNPDVGAWESPLDSPVLAVEPLQENGLPQSYALRQNYPNPFNPATTIEFALPKSGWVMLKVYNILGESIATLVSEELSAGEYRYNWNAVDLASGLYFYRLEAGDFSESRKMLLVR